MPRLILHIGAEKTGTTSLQQAAKQGHGSTLWFPSRELGGLNMPLIAHAFGEPGCVRDFLPRIRMRIGDISPMGAQELIAAEIQRQQELPVFLSSELLYSRFGRDGHVRLRDILSKYSDDVTVCCVLRDVRPTIDGLLGELLKGGRPVDDPDHIFAGLFGFENSGYFDFAGKIDDLRSVYGDSLTLLRYETLAADGQLIPSFFDAVGLPCGPQDLALNPKLNHVQGWALQRLNRMTRELPYRSLPFRVFRRGLRWLLGGFGRAFVPSDSIPALTSEAFRRRVSSAQRQLDELLPE